MNISVSKFKGTAPKIEPRLLSSEYAQLSTNIRYDSGSLVPINDFTDIATIPAGSNISSIYKYRVDTSTDKWLYFNSDVMLVKDAINNNTDDRIIISGLDTPRIFDKAVVLANDVIDNTNTYILGLPVPIAPTMTVAAQGSGNFESRAYTIQYDRQWSSDNKVDAGAYSEPAETGTGELFVDLTSNGAVSISNISDAPAGYGITHISINRSGTTTQDSSFHFVDSFKISDAKLGIVPAVSWNSTTNKFTYMDIIDTAEVGVAAINQDWVSPSNSMKGIIGISSGMLAGYYDNYVCISEPYQAHAWPEQYKVAIGRPVVGLGYFGDIVVVCTDAEPYIIQLTDPATAIAFPIKEFAPCISAAGIVSYRDAVVYPSNAGFMRVDRLGVANLTQSLANIRDMKNFNLTNVKAAGMGFYYYVLFTTGTNERRLLMFNMQDPELGFGLCDSDISCLFSDFETASLFAVHTTTAGEQRLGKFDDSNSALVFSWKSKVFMVPEDTINLSAARMQFDKSALGTGGVPFEIAELMFSFNSRQFNDGPLNGPRSTSSAKDYLLFNLYVDKTLVFTKKVYNNKPFRLPSGFIGKDYEITLTGAVSVYKIDLSSSMSELTDA